MTFRALLPIANPPIPLSEAMPKHFVPGMSVHALCKTVFGDKVAKNVHGDRWKTAEVPGVSFSWLLPFLSSTLLLPCTLTPTNLCIQDFGLERRRKKGENERERGRCEWGSTLEVGVGKGE